VAGDWRRKEEEEGGITCLSSFNGFMLMVSLYDCVVLFSGSQPCIIVGFLSSLSDPPAVVRGC
jgi:hypothetical protein